MVKPGVEVLPCGCVLTGNIVNGKPVLTIAPCRMSCVNFANALALADEKRVPVEYREGP